MLRDTDGSILPPEPQLFYSNRQIRLKNRFSPELKTRSGRISRSGTSIPVIIFIAVTIYLMLAAFKSSSARAFDTG